MLAGLFASAGIALASGGDSPDAASQARGAPQCAGKTADIVGTPGDDQGVDQISGTAGNDVIVALDGDDAVAGGKGNDTICARPGNDNANGGDGNDLIRGGKGNDTIFGGKGKDDLRGGKGDDKVFGESGDDDLKGGPDKDACNGGTGKDKIETCETDPDEPPNDPPIAADDAGSTDEDSVATVDVLDNDTDPDGDPLTVDSASVAKGTATVVGGSIEFDPNGEFEDLGDAETEQVGVSYEIDDGRGGSDQGTLTMTVTGVDDAPVAVDDTRTVEEDASPPGTPIEDLIFDPRENDTDVDGGPKVIIDATEPEHGTLFLVDGGNPGEYAGFAYIPDPDYCNDPGPEPTDDFTYTLNGGDIGNVAVTVTCVDDHPVAVNDATTVAEDSAPVTILVRGNDTDPDGNFTIQSVTQPTNGDVQITNAGADLTYEPDDDYCNDPGAEPTDDFTYTLTPGGSSATVAVTVTCSNDAPVNTVPGDQSTNEDTNLVFSNGNGNAISVADVDDASLTVTLTATNGTLTLGGTAGLAFTVGDGTADTTMTFMGTKAQINSALNGLSFAPTGNYNGPASLQVATTDGNTTDTDSVAITVNPVNDAPIVDLNGAGAGTGNEATFNEPGPAVDLAPATDVTDVDDTNLVSAQIKLTNKPDTDSESLSVDVTGTPINAAAYDSGTGILALTGNATLAQYQQVLRTAKYNNTQAPPNSADRLVEFKVNDGDTDSVVATATVNVVPLNEAPIVDLNGAVAGIDRSFTFSEGGGSLGIGNVADVTDTDDTNLESATVTLTNPLDGAAETLTVDLTGTGITLDPSSTAHLLKLTGSATVANYQQALRNVRYDTADDDPDTSAARVVTFVANDGQDDSATATATISITATNDAPTLDLNGAGAGVDATASFTEDGPPADLAPAADVADPDDTNIESADITLTNPQDGALESISVVVTGTPITLGGASTGHHLILTGTATKAQYQQVLRTAKYNNTDQDPLNTSRIVNFKVNDGSADSGTPKTTVTITALNDAPEVDMNGAGAGIDSNAAFIEDSSPANPGSGAVALGSSATTTDVDNGTLASATITLTNHPDGAVESVGVTIPGGNPITVSNNNSHALTLNGPATKAQFQAAIQAVKYNNTSNTPNTTNRDVTTVVNDGSANSATAHTTVTVTPTNDAPTAVDDTLNGTDSAVGNTPLAVGTTQAQPRKVVDCTVPDSCSVLTRGTDDSDPDGPNALTVGPTGAQAITTADGGKVTLEADGNFTYFPAANDPSCADNSDSFDYTLSDGGTNGTDTGTVTIAVANCVWYVDSGAAAGGTGTATSAFNSLTGVNGAGGAGDSDGASDTIFIMNTGSFTGGLPLENNQRLFGPRFGLDVPGFTIVSPSGGASNPTISNAAGNALALATSNTVQAIDLGNAGGAGNSSLAGISVGTALAPAIMNNAANGSGSINNTTGKAVDISGGELNMAFTGVSSSGSGTDGIHLDNVSGTFNASGGSIQNATGEDVDLFGDNSGDSVNFTYDGTISDATGSAVRVQGQNAGTKDFNGAIGTAGSPAGVISLSSNTGATMRFDGGVNLSTGTSGAFSATGGGTVVVPDPAGATTNKLTTSTGTALNIANTNIGAGGLTFESISSSGALNGIVLNTTGASGGLTITGNGGTCSSVASCTGGAIQNATGDAVKLTNANDVILTDMAITSSDGSWVDATTVDGINLVRINANSSTDDGFLGNSVRDLVIQGGTYFGGGKDGEPTCNIDGFFITNLLGTSSITGTTFQRSNTRQFFVVNTAATSFAGTPDSLTVSGTTWNNHAGPCGGDHLSVSSDTGGNFRVITNASAGINTVNTGGIGVQASATGTNGKMDASVTGLKTSGNTAGAAFGGTTNGSITYDVFDNNTDPPGTVNDTGFTGTGSLALAEVCTTTASCVGTWDNNTISATAGAGTDAVQAALEGNGTNTIAITNNDITGNFQRGINLSSGGGTGAVGTLNATVANNTINNSDPAGLQGINVTAGLSGSPGNGETNKVCLNLSGNTSSSAGSVGYRFTNRASNVFQLQNFSGSGASDPDIVNWVNTVKGNVGTVAVQNDPATFAPLSSAPGNCPTPP
ncbi:MAG: hypothetical protein QOI31_2592 [Solirubrobacterales bacterium]|nr:hypothetical protein [Solirubrobacterales bacterium]